MQTRPGNVLPLALIMTMTILMASIGLGSIVLEGTQRAKATDESLAAYYMSDAGIERQLYEVRKRNQTLEYIQNLDEKYPNGSSWQSTAKLEPTSKKIISYIATSSFAVVDLFDPDDLTTPPGVEKLNITWLKDPACDKAASVLEVSYAYWELQGNTPKLPDDNSYFILDKNNSYNLLVSPLDKNRSYRIRIRAFECSAVHVVVQLQDGNGQPKNFPGDMTLSAEGTYGKASQKIAVTMPKLDVLSGLFSFVIFSECTLLKGMGQQVCPP